MKYPVKAVLFDLDGVLVHSPLDLAAIKTELFGDEKVFIIEGLEALGAREREEKSAILLQRELEAASKAVLAPGVNELFDWLEAHGIKRGIITRNTREAVKVIVGKHAVDFGVVIAREDAPPKPDPECVHEACRALGVEPGESVMVGDFIFDIEAGRNAGCRTVFLETEKFKHLETGADARIQRLSELIEILDDWVDVNQI